MARYSGHFTNLHSREKNMKIRALIPVAIAALGFTNTSHATNGYFAHGYGIKSQGMGGVGIALPHDALAAAHNPAGMALVGDRVDFGLTWFRPIRESVLVGTAGGSGAFDGTYSANDTTDFLIPEFGYNRMVTPTLSLGVSVYGHGGMNTDYKRAVPLLGTTPPGVDLAQLFIAPTVAWKITPSQTVGISLNLAYQRFEAKGLQNFTASSIDPNAVTNNGHDSSTGWGVHIGWIGQVTDAVTLGATYQSRTYMGKFDKYRGLFAEGGDFDVPSHYGFGIAVKATPEITVEADVQRIHYSDIKSVGAPLANFFIPAPLGADNGPGFGWRDVTVFNLGASYVYSNSLTLRAGYDHTTQPIPRNQTFFNILAPGVVQDHLTLGATWTLPNKAELSVAYMHAFEEKVNGSGSIPLAFGGGETNLKMYEDSIGIAYGWQL